MLKLIDGSGNSIPLVQYENLMIESALEYDDKALSFSMPAEIVPVELVHENFIRTQKDEFVIKEINSEGDMVSVKAKLNIDELEGTFFESFNTSEQTITQAMQLALSGTGWTVDTTLTKKRTLKLTNIYVWDIVKQIIETYHVEIQIDSINKNITFVEQRGSDKGIYFTSQLNLKSISKKSDTNEFYTRIKPVGKDGLTIADVNNGKDYLENYQYSSKVKTYYWKDERYTAAESLIEDAAAKLNDLSKPYCAYSCEIMDLAANSDKYSILEYALGDSIWLLDEKSNTREKQRIVKILEYPDSPENSSCELANTVLTFEEYTQKYDATSDAVDNIMVDNGTVDGDCIDEIDSSKIVNLDIVVANEVTAQTVNITKELNAVSGKIGELETNKLSVTDAQITYATIKSLDGVSGRFESFYTGEFKAVSAETDSLKTNVGDIKTLMFGSASGNTIQTQFSNSVIAQLGDAQIESAMIAELDAGKIKSGSIYTNLVHIYGDENNRLSIVDNTITINDGINTRVQIGKDAAGDYNMYLWDTDGNLMFDALGLTEDGITRQIIRDDVVKDNANISASKLNIDSLFSVINEDGSHTLKSSKIYVDADGQTLDVSFKNMTTNVSTAVTNANAAVSTANTASSNANTALSTANTAKSTADAAKTTASSASSTANTAKKTADTAKETADSALGKANTNTANITNLTTTVSTQGTQLTTIQGQISSKIWQQDITKEISKIEIGGRNLQLGSRNWDDSAFYSKGSASISNGELTAVMSNTTVETHFINVNQGDVFTLGIDVKSTNVYTGNTVLIEFFNTSGTRTSYIWVLSDVTTKWKRITNTFTVNDTSASCMRIGLRSSSGYVNTYRLLKIERGNTATDWTPAPEDTETSITTLSTQYNTLDQTINSMSSTIASHTTQIAAKADNSTVTTVSSKVTSLEQSLSGFQTTVSNTYATKTALSGKKDSIYAKFDGGGNSALYCHLAQLKITTSYINTPIVIEVDQRSRGYSQCSIRFSPTNNADPALADFKKTGSPQWFIVKSATSTWDIYVRKSESYDRIVVTDHINEMVGITVTWKCVNANAVSGWTEAGQLAAFCGVDGTAGGTSGSGSLITSGAVYKGISSVTSSIEQLSDEIALTVKETDITGNYLIGKINLTSTTATIAASHINLAGAVTISALASDVTNQINTANTNATTALNTANSASATAGTANATAAQAKSVAESAKTTAANANTAAGNALDTADDAINTATTASTNASTALSTANTAKTNASSALGRATYQYGTCSTAAATAAKVVTLSGFTLFTGARISVKFTYANTVASPTLNVNSTGAKTIYAYGAAIAVNSPYSWNAGATVDFIYNGTQWEIAANSANGLIAWWCANNNKTYIDGAKLYAGTVTATKIAANAITADKIATDAIKSRNYVADSTGSYLNLADGSFDSKNLKWDLAGNLTCSSANITGGNINFSGGSTEIRIRIKNDSNEKAFLTLSSQRMYLTNGNCSIYADTLGEYLSFAIGGNSTFLANDDGIATKAITSTGAITAGGEITAGGGITAGGQITATGTFEAAPAGNSSNLILRNNYDRQAWIRYDENFALNFVPHTSSGFDLTHRVYMDMNTGSVYAAAYTSSGFRLFGSGTYTVLENTSNGYTDLTTGNAVRSVNKARNGYMPMHASGFVNQSSRRYKIPKGIMNDSEADRLMKLNVVKFDYINGDKNQYGLYAEDTYNSVPECVYKNEKNIIDGIDYTKLIPFMIKKIQMQDREIKRLENIVAHLTGIAMQNCAGGI